MHLRTLARILGAQGLSSLGTSISTIALAYMVLKLTGSVLQMGGIMAISTFPLVVTSFVGGAILDRYSARNIMVLADVGRAVLIFLMPFLAERSIGYIYLVAGLMGVLSSLFNPGQVKLISEMVERGSLVRANSYMSVSQNGAELFGYLVGAPLVIALGYTATFAVNAVTYVLSALLLVGLPRGGRVVSAGSGAPLDGVSTAETGGAAATGAASPGAVATLGAEVPRFRSLVAEAPRVVAMIWRRPALRTNLLLATFAATAVMMSIPNSYGLVFDIFDRGAWGLTTLEVFIASGMILGGLLMSRLRLSGDKNAYVSLALVAMGICFIGVSFSPLFWLSIALMGIGGVFNLATVVPSMTLFQEMPAQEYKGRMIAIRAGFGQVGTTGGLLIGGVLGEVLGIREAFLIAGLVGIGLTAVLYLPYRVMAARRRRAAWSAAVAGGACRRDAHAFAEAVALSGAALDEDALRGVQERVQFWPQTRHVAAGGVGYVRSDTSAEDTAAEGDLVARGAAEGDAAHEKVPGLIPAPAGLDEEA